MNLTMPPRPATGITLFSTGSAWSAQSCTIVALMSFLTACSPTVATRDNSSVVDESYAVGEQLDEYDELDELDALDSLDPDPTSDHSPEVDKIAPRWAERSFKGNSQYTITNDGSGELLKGQTDGQASVLYRQDRINVAETPWLIWDWKIRNTYSIDNERSKQGDDYPVRIYVVVQTGLLPWETLAINYVWSSGSIIGSHWHNPFSDKAVMVVLDSGDQKRMQWISHRRHIVDDFKRFHDIDVAAIDGYAYMIDGDNTGSSGTSWVRNIRFSASP